MANKLKIGQDLQSVEKTLERIKKLKEDHNYRDTQGVFYIEGVRNFVQVVDNGFSISTIFYSDRLLTAGLARKFVRELRRRGIHTIKVSPEEFRLVSTTQRASGIGAIVHQRWTHLQNVSIDSGLFWVVLQNVHSEGNLGTLIRTSEAVGGAGFIFLGKSIDPFSPAIERASMGAVFNQQFVRTEFGTFQKVVKAKSS